MSDRKVDVPISLFDAVQSSISQWELNLTLQTIMDALIEMSTTDKIEEVFNQHLAWVRQWCPGCHCIPREISEDAGITICTRCETPIEKRVENAT